MKSSIFGTFITPFELYLDTQCQIFFETLGDYLKDDNRKKFDNEELYALYQSIRNDTIELDLSSIDEGIHTNVQIHPYFELFYQKKDDKVVWVFPTVQDVFTYVYRHNAECKNLFEYFNNFGDREIISKLSVLYWMFRDNDSFAELLYLYLHNNCIPEGINPIDEFHQLTSSPYQLFDMLGEISKRDINAFIDRRMEYLNNQYSIDRLDTLDRAIALCNKGIYYLNDYVTHHPDDPGNQSLHDTITIFKESVTQHLEERVGVDFEVQMELDKLYQTNDDSNEQ